MTPLPDRTSPLPEVFLIFLRLGLTSFGGPVAHLGYFRGEFVARRGWMTDAAFGDLLALCQFLPGPTSSQVGFGIGLARAGWPGALAAFVGFTLPSALALTGFALLAGQITGGFGAGALQGLTLAAVAIVAQAVIGMARTLCPDAARALIATVALGGVLLVPGQLAMPLAICGGALAGMALGRGVATTGAAPLHPVAPALSFALLALFGLLFLGLPLLASLGPVATLADTMFRAGALVFGGGHVLLPLLEPALIGKGLIEPEAFLAGYGATQAMPGPIFTFAGYLGMVAAGPAGALVALTAVFLPGFLLLAAALPWWDRLRALPSAQSALQGANAAVVGILGAALLMMIGHIGSPRDATLAIGCFVLLSAWRCPPWALVILAAALGGLLA